jgi:hypothetical protein
MRVYSNAGQSKVTLAVPPLERQFEPADPLQISGVSHQKVIRDRESLVYDPLIEEKRRLAQSYENASVREIPYQTAKNLIQRYEWLGDMGCTDFSFGLYFGEHLAGVECFGRTAGTKVAGSVCGVKYAHMVKTLCRGACAHWADHSVESHGKTHTGAAASYLINRSCKLMAEKGFHIFVAYSDAEAKEIGTVYQASGWEYCGTTQSGSSLFVWPEKPVAKDSDFGTLKDGKLRDDRCIQHFIRVRSDRMEPYRVKCSRREMRERMIREGFLFIKSPPKRRYVGFYGNRNLVRELRAALKWETFPKPKRLRSHFPSACETAQV